jgi:hypothetical protein
MAFSMFPLLLLLLAGGENSLSGYLDTEAYLKTKGIAYEVEALRAVLTLEENPDPDQIEALLQQLGDDVRERREEATQKLIDLGAPVRPFVVEQMKNPDPEVSSRAKLILKQLPSEDEDRSVLRMMAIRGLGELKDEASKDLLNGLMEDVGSAEAVMARVALDRIAGKTIPVPELADRSEVLSRFPETIQFIAQARLGILDSPLEKKVTESEFLQEQLANWLSTFGDIRVHRITIGAPAGLFLNGQEQLFAFIELDYQPLRFAKGLMSMFNYKAAKSGEMVVVHNRNVMIWPMSDHQLLVVMHSGRSSIDELAKQAESFSNTVPELHLPKALTQIINSLEEEKELWAVGILPENMEEAEMRIPAELMNYSSGTLTATIDKEGLLFDVNVDAKDEDILKGTVAEVKASKEQAIGQMMQQQQGPMGEIVKMLESIEISQDGKQAKAKGLIPFSLAEQMFRLFGMRSQRMQRHQMQMQNEMNIHRHGGF